MIKKIYFGSLLFFAAALLSAANLYFKGTTDKSPIEYKSGETMKFSVSLMKAVLDFAIGRGNNGIRGVGFLCG